VTPNIFVPPTSEAHAFSILAGQMRQSSIENAAHAKRVSALAVLFGRALDLSVNELKDLKIAGVLHDIGKLHIPLELLHAPRSLTLDETLLIRTHPERGYALACRFNFAPRILEVIHYHHERYDGAGYPHGLRGTEIPFYARLAAIVDVYDAIISKRIYQVQPRSFADSMFEIERCAGTQFDPALAAVFIQLMHRRTRRRFHKVH